MLVKFMLTGNMFFYEKRGKTGFICLSVMFWCWVSQFLLFFVFTLE